MLRATYNDEDIFVLNDAPDWEGAVSMDVELLADLVAGLTQREARTPLSGTLRVPRFQYTAVVQGVAARELSECLRDLQREAVVVPAWPMQTYWRDRASMGINSAAGMWIYWKDDWSVWAIVPGGTNPGLPDDYLVAPALWGRLDKRGVRPIRGDVVEFDVAFVEQSPIDWALSPAAVDWDEGPSPSGPYNLHPPALIPFGINFEGPAQSCEVAIIRQQIGFGRSPAETVYPQLNTRGQSTRTVTQDGATLGQLLRFFLDHGAGKIFWASQWTVALELTAPMGAGDTVLQVDDASTVREGDYLGFEGVEKTARVVGTNAGAGTVTIDAALGVEYGLGTLISQLILCRFEKTRLTVQWLTAGIGEANLPVREVPPEYVAAADEVVGTTIGLMPARVYSYLFSSTGNGGAAITWAFTSYESSAIGVGVPARISHGEIRQGIALERDEVQVRMFLEDGIDNPLLALACLRQEMPLYCAIKENGVEVFYGEVVKVGVKGSELTATVVSGGTLFDRTVPRPRFQLGCNNALFDAGCKLNRGSWSYLGNLHADYVVGYPFQVVIESLDPPGGGGPAAPGAHFFALGYFEIMASLGEEAGFTWQIRAVLQSTAYAGGLMTLTLDRDLVPVGKAGDQVLIVAGCDLTASTCKTKFNNYANFFGHPMLPLANPSLVKKNPSTAGGKK